MPALWHVPLVLNTDATDHPLSKSLIIVNKFSLCESYLRHLILRYLKFSILFINKKGQLYFICFYFMFFYVF